MRSLSKWNAGDALTQGDGDTMTTELQAAMARYEGARIAYQKAVLASLAGPAGGAGIRASILECKESGAALKRLQAPSRRIVVEVGAAENEPSTLLSGIDFFRKLLKAS